MAQTLLLRPCKAARLGSVLQRFTSTTTNTQQLAEVAVQQARPVTEIPGPRIYPLIGSIPSIMMDKDYDSKRIHKFWGSLIGRYGPIVRLVNPGVGHIVVVASAEDCEKLNRITMDKPQRTSFSSLMSLRYNWTDNYFEKRSGILTEQGDEWWRVRSRVQTPLLKPTLVREYLTEMDEITLTFMDRIQELQEKHGEMPDSFQGELYKWALESVGVVALDKRFGCLGAPAGSLEARRGEELINIVNNLVASLGVTEMKMQLWRLFPTPSYIKLRDNHEKLLKIVSENMAETVEFLRQKSEAKGGGEGEARQHSVLQTLLTTPGLTQKDVLTFIMDLVFAGIDTCTHCRQTSHTMGFCLYLLARNPEAQKKLQEEVDEVTQGLQGPLTPQHMARLSYLKAVVKETFRFFPLTFAFRRMLHKDIELRGYRIPAGHHVFSLNTMAGHGSSVFPRADEFLPERWLRDRPLGDIHPYATVPFGAGPRMCVGRRVAEQEMYTLLARMAQRFNIEYHHEDIDMNFGLVFYPSRPLRFSFLAR